MSTTPTPAPVQTPDAAYQNFQAAEGAYSSALNAKANADAALASAQQAQTSAAGTLSQAASDDAAAVDALIGALTTYKQSLIGTPAPSAPAPDPTSTQEPTPAPALPAATSDTSAT